MGTKAGAETLDFESADLHCFRVQSPIFHFVILGRSNLIFSLFLADVAPLRSACCHTPISQVSIWLAGSVTVRFHLDVSFCEQAADFPLCMALGVWAMPHMSGIMHQRACSGFMCA